jgi:hypothetical protein
MTDKPQTDLSQNDRTPDATDAATGGSAGQRRPDQGGAPAGKDEAEPATGGEGAAGAGGSGGFGRG